MNISQKDLAAKIGVSFAQISQYERGDRNPKIETLMRIADALGLDINFFIESRNYIDISNNNPEFLRVSEVKKPYITKSTEKSGEADSSTLENAINLAELTLLEESVNFTDNFLQGKLFKYYEMLNKLGKLEAVRFLETLSSTEKYSKRERV